MTMIQFANEELLLDANAAIYWPARQTLIVSDLHFEKGSYLASYGNLLPGYDTLDTLERLQKLVDFYTPQEVICLGDNMHDGQALMRMSKQHYQILRSLCSSVKNWRWIVGNHDKNLPDDPIFADFTCVENWVTPEFIFCHEFANINFPQIIGHFHPKITLKKNDHIISGKCFIYSDKLLIMPSFGTYTGGLEINSAVLQNLFSNTSYACYMLKNNKVWKVK